MIGLLSFLTRYYLALMPFSLSEGAGLGCITLTLWGLRMYQQNISHVTTLPKVSVIICAPAI